jgi:protein-disulfide isomerase
VRRAVPLLFFATLQVAFGATTAIVEGNPKSSVRVQIYEDLQCGDSARFETVLDQKLLPKYGGRVAFIHRDFPLGEHGWARLAAIAARWVYEQDPALGIDFRHEILAEQDSITEKNLRSWLGEFAVRNHLDVRGIIASLNDVRLGAMVDQDLESGKARGVIKVSTVLINGETFVETILFEDVARAIDDALK